MVIIILLLVIRVPSFGESNNDVLTRNINVEMINHNVPGVMVTIVKEGKIYYQGALGEANTLTKTPMDTTLSIFQTGSISKVLTTYGLLNLLEAQNIGTDEKIGPYLPEYLKHNDYLSDLTFKNLMTHTTGIATLKANSATMDHPLNSLSPSFDVYAKEFFESYKLKPVIEKDKYTIFSNVGYIISGLLIESISNDRYEYYMSKHVLEPLGMKTSIEILMDRSLTGYSLVQNYAVFGGQRTALSTFRSKFLPSDDFLTTIEDMTKLLIAFTGDTIASEIHDAMFTRQVANNALTAGRSFGFSVVNFGNYEAYLHDGGIPGSNSRLLIIPEINVAFFLTYNSNDLMARDSFTKVILNELIGDFQQVTQYEPFEIDDLSKFTGVFSPVNTSTETLERLTKIIHQVRVRENGSELLIDGISYVAISETIFYSASSSNFAEYRTNEKGQLEYLIVGNSIYEKTPIFQSALVEATLLLLMALFNLLSLLIILTKWSEMKVNRIHDTPRVILLFHSLAITGVLGFVFLISSSYDIWDVILGLNQAVLGTKFFGFALILLTLPTFVMINRAKQDYRWSKIMIFIFQTQMVLGIALVVWLYLYNLLV